MPSVPIESWEERQDREDRIDKAMRAARLHRRTAPLTRDRNRNYKLQGLPRRSPVCQSEAVLSTPLCLLPRGRVAASPLLANYTKTVFRSQYGTRRRGLRGILCMQRENDGASRK